MHSSTPLSQFTLTEHADGSSSYNWHAAVTETQSVVDWFADKLRVPRERAIARLVSLLLALLDTLRAKGITSVHDPRVGNDVFALCRKVADIEVLCGVPEARADEVRVFLRRPRA